MDKVPKEMKKKRESGANGGQGVISSMEETPCVKSVSDSKWKSNECSQVVVSDNEPEKKSVDREREADKLPTTKKKKRESGIIEEQWATSLNEPAEKKKKKKSVDRESEADKLPTTKKKKRESGIIEKQWATSSNEPAEKKKMKKKKKKRQEEEEENRISEQGNIAITDNLEVGNIVHSKKKKTSQGGSFLGQVTAYQLDKSKVDRTSAESLAFNGSQGSSSGVKIELDRPAKAKKKKRELGKNGEQGVMILMEETSCDKSALDTIPLEQNENEGSPEVVSDKEPRKKRKRADKTPKADKNQEPGTNGELRVASSYEEVVSVKERKKKRKVSFGGATVLGPKENCQEQASQNLENLVEQEECISPKDQPTIISPSEEVPFRFSKEEDAIIAKEFMNYIEGKGWDLEEGLHNIFEKRQSCVYNIWDEMVIALPHRSKKSIANRARRVLTNSKRGPWSQEEVDLLFKLYEVHGNNWLAISKEIGRHRKDARLKWRYTKDRKNKGAWTQEELEKLAAVVHRCYEVKSKLKDTGANLNKAGLRDGLSWESIAKEVGTRPYSTCIVKWYRDLRSSMVATGEWADNDDQILLKRLLDGEATDEEAVDWEKLVENRSGLTCQKRWKQMVKTLGEQKAPLDFEAKLELITRRFAPTLLGGHEDIPEASDK